MRLGSTHQPLAPLLPPNTAALLAIVNKWTLLFTSHLQRYVTEQTQEMNAFVTGVLEGLEEDASGSKDALKRNMAHIRDVRKTRYIRKANLAPLRKAVVLLKKYGVSVDDAKIGATPTSLGVPLTEYLESADLKVESCINRTFQKKEQSACGGAPSRAEELAATLPCPPPAVLPLQTAEMEKIKVQASAFEDGVRDFWNGFRKNAPFAFTGPVDEAYAQLDRYYAQLVKVGAREGEGVFSVPCVCRCAKVVPR